MSLFNFSDLKAIFLELKSNWQGHIDHVALIVKWCVLHYVIRSVEILFLHLLLYDFLDVFFFAEVSCLYLYFTIQLLLECLSLNHVLGA